MVDEMKMAYLRKLCYGALEYASIEGSAPIMTLNRSDWIPDDFPKGTLIYKIGTRSTYRFRSSSLEKWLANNPARKTHHENSVV